jgi:hypothetical protein
VAAPLTEEQEAAATAPVEGATGDVEMIKEKKEGEEGAAEAKPGEKAPAKPGEKAPAAGDKKAAPAAEKKAPEKKK